MPADKPVSRETTGRKTHRRGWLPPVAMVVVTAIAGWLIVTELPGWLERDGQAQPVATPSAEPTVPADPDALPEVRPIDYRTFADPTGLAFTGAALHSGAAIQLTDGANQAGGVWSANSLDPARPFSTAFRFTSTERSGQVSFVLRTGGIVDDRPVERLVPRLTIDFVISATRDGGTDRNANTVLVTSATSSGSRTLGTTQPALDLGGGPITVWVDYSAKQQKIRVYASAGTAKPADPIITAPLKLNALLGTNPAYAGFAASTREVAGGHDLLAWHLSPPTGRP
ncbi:hypothetical protein GCM10027290_15570 [Micromonospora sonneratiae]